MRSIEARITQLWGEITVATHQFLELIAEFDLGDGWQGAGMASCAQWLNLHCGIGEVAAREKLRVAHALRELPEINSAFADGRVSYSKVRAMTRVATAENEAVLLSIALNGTASHVERTVRHFRRVERLEEAAQAASVYRQRSVRFRHDEDGSVVISGRLPAEVGELVRLAVERAAELVDADEAVEPEEPDYSFDRFSRGRAEGLRLMAERFLAEAGTESATSSSADRYQVVVHIDEASLSDNAGDGCCEIEDGQALAVETARRLACGGSLVGIVEDAEGTPLDIGRKTRAIPKSIERALKARDGGCRFPGCMHTRFTEGHHIVHWSKGGETKLHNLVTLCNHHHHLVHEGGFGLERAADGELVFTRPDGRRLEHSRPAEKCFRGNISAPPSRAAWKGERMDYSLAIGALIAARDADRSFPAGR